MPQVSERLLHAISSVCNAMPRAAACVAITVVAQDAMPARNSQPGVTLVPLPPHSGGMSVVNCVPLACRVVMLRPPSQCALATESSCTPAAGRRASTSVRRPMAAPTSCSERDAVVVIRNSMDGVLAQKADSGRTARARQGPPVVADCRTAKADVLSA